MDARKFWTACRVHDWHYQMTDDPGAYALGAQAHQELVNTAYSHADLTAIFEAWRDHHFNAGARPAEPKMEE